MTSDGTGDRSASDSGATPAEGRTGVFVVASDAERRDAFAVRQTVFVDEQGVDEEIEYDEHDESLETTHFVGYDESEAIGAARLRPVSGPLERIPNSADGSIGKVERVAVVAEKRGEGWGDQLMGVVEAHAQEREFDRLALHAQIHVREFYERLGYDAYGEEFTEAGIPHIAMAKEI